MSKEAFVTLATNDTYGLGALVLGRSLRRVATAKQTVVMITPDVSQKMKEELGHVFNLVVTVDLLDSGDVAHLALMKRPELGVTFTKLHAWKLIQFSKCVFLDADTLVVQNCDELFEKEELSAAPDPGWPDCFNSGVFVFVPSETTFKALMDFAVAHGSFDGGDQGLLNMFFREWATQDIRKHLSFVYNVVSSATYSYLPALKFFGSQVKIVHFLGSNKPWLRQSEGSTSTPYQRAWWTIFREDVAGRLSSEMIVATPLTGCRTPPTPPPRYQFKDPWETVRSESHCKNRQQDITSNSLNQDIHQSQFSYVFVDHSYCGNTAYPLSSPFNAVLKDEVKTIPPSLQYFTQSPTIIPKLYSLENDIAKYHNFASVNHDNIVKNISEPQRICDLNHPQYNIQTENKIANNLNRKPSSKKKKKKPQNQTGFLNCQNKLEIIQNSVLTNYGKKIKLEIETQSFPEISLDHDGDVISIESVRVPTEPYSNNCKFNGHIDMESNTGQQGSIEIDSIPHENCFCNESHLHSESNNNGLKTPIKATDTSKYNCGKHDRLYDHITAESHTIDSIPLQSSCDESYLNLETEHNCLKIIKKATEPTENFSGKHDKFDDCIAAENNSFEFTPLQSSSCNEKREQIDAGIAGSLAGGVPEEWRREAWEAGDVDYLGRDSFDNIWKRICECVGITSQAASAPDSKPTEPAPSIQKPAETAPVLEKSVEPVVEKAVESAPTSKTPTETVPAQEKSAGDISTPEKEEATEKKLVKPIASEKLVESVPSAVKPAEPLPLAEPAPVTKTTADPLAAAEKPLESVTEVKPSDIAPAAEKPLESVTEVKPSDIAPAAEKPLESVTEVKPSDIVPAAEKPLESVTKVKPVGSVPATEILAEPITTIEKTVESTTPALEQLKEPLQKTEKIAESSPADVKTVEPAPATEKQAVPLPVAAKSVEPILAVEKLPEPLQTTEKSVEAIQDTEKPIEPLPAVEKPTEQPEKVLEAVPVLEKQSESTPSSEKSEEAIPASVTDKTSEKALDSVAEKQKVVLPAAVISSEPVVEKIAESTLPSTTPAPAAEVCPLKSTPPSETKQTPPEVPVQAILPRESEPKPTPLEPLPQSGIAPVCKKEPGTPTVIPPSGPSSPLPADVAPEVCKLQATPSQPATPPASSHQSTDAPVPPKRKQGKNGKPGKGKK